MSLADVQIRNLIERMLAELLEDVQSGDIPYERTPDEGVATLRYRVRAKERGTSQEMHGLVLVAVSEQKDLIDILERTFTPP